MKSIADKVFDATYVGPTVYRTDYVSLAPGRVGTAERIDNMVWFRPDGTERGWYITPEQVRRVRRAPRGAGPETRRRL